jgi:hypothetical protein
MTNPQIAKWLRPQAAFGNIIGTPHAWRRAKAMSKTRRRAGAREGRASLGTMPD